MAALTRQSKENMNLSKKQDMYLYEFLVNGGRTGYSQMFELKRVAKDLGKRSDQRR